MDLFKGKKVYCSDLIVLIDGLLEGKNILIRGVG